jgi:hypothetical protein
MVEESAEPKRWPTVYVVVSSGLMIVLLAEAT